MTSDVDITAMPDKHFHTYRKSKVFDEKHFLRWSGLNLINNSFMRKSNHVWDAFERDNFLKKLVQERASAIVNLDNEYMTFRMMGELRRKSKN